PVSASGGSVAHADPAPSESGRGTSRSAFIAFRNPHFKWHWLSTLASFSGMQMQMIAVGILGWEISHSYAVVGVLQAAFALPMALLSLPGGAVVDRMEKRRVVALSQAVLGLLGLAIAVLIHADLITVVLLFMSGVVQGAMFSVNGPARMALLTEMVETELLPAAISMQNIAMNSTRVVAPAVAGLFIAFVSIQGAYYVTALLYASTVWSILQIPRSSAHMDRAKAPLMTDIRVGLRYVAGDRLLRSLMLSGLVMALFIMPYQVMLPGFADGLGSPGLYGPMVAVSGLGGLAGSFGVAAIAQYPRKPYLQFLLGLTAGAALVGLGMFSSTFGPAGAFTALAIIGAASTSYMTLNQTMLMTDAAPQFRGRVMSMSMLTFSAMPLMALPLGVLADVVGGGGAFLAQGAIVIAVILTLGLVNRSYTFARGTTERAEGAAPAEARRSGL
ncbi:MAG: MFS transporter, partial [Chloroflexi bacterium]|nr:MFS transporter [Chloroflexota bacterium]